MLTIKIFFNFIYAIKSKGDTMSISTSEPILDIGHLNQKIKELLRDATYLDDKKISDAIRNIIRKVSIAELFYKQYLIAVTGPQGQGKSSLISALYNIGSDYFPSNVGRGETEPIIIKESDEVDAIKCYKYCLNGGNTEYVEISKEELKQIAQDGKADEKIFFLEIRLPSSKFNQIGTSRAFLLLPGIEPNNKSSWQKDLRYYLLWSASAVMVAARDKMAQNEAGSYKKELDEFLGKQSYAIAFTHNDEEQSDAEYSQVAATLEISQNILALTGIKNGTLVGRERFISAINNIKSQKEWKLKNTETLRDIIDDELGIVMDDIHSIIKESRQEEMYGEATTQIEENLEWFEEGCKSFKKAYQGELEKAVYGLGEKVASKLREQSLISDIMAAIFKGGEKQLRKEIQDGYGINGESGELHDAIHSAMVKAIKNTVKNIDISSMQSLSFDSLQNTEKGNIKNYFKNFAVFHKAKLNAKDIVESEPLGVNDAGALRAFIDNIPSSIDILSKVIMKSNPKLAIAAELAPYVIDIVTDAFKYLTEKEDIVDKITRDMNSKIVKTVIRGYDDEVYFFKEKLTEELCSSYGIELVRNERYKLLKTLAAVQKLRIQYKKELEV